MAGGGGSTGGIGAQSPAVNPPNPMGQISNQIGNVAGSAFGGAQQPMLQTGQFGSQPIPMGNNPAYNGQPQGPMGGMAPDYATSFPTPRGFGQTPQQGPFMGGVSAPNSPGQAPFDPRMMGGEGFTPGFGQPPFMAQAPQQLGGQPDPYLAQVEQQQMAQMAQDAAMQRQQAGLGQAAQTGALTQPQMAGLGNLAALLGGGQARPAPAMAPNPGRPAPVATKPPPVAAKPVVAKPSMVPPKTPPAVASAIQKLAAKKPIGKR